MIDRKLIVLLISAVVHANSLEYCTVCSNHTLCKYTKLGPSAACMEYDTSALLTRDDIVEIVNRINEHRHFVALGRSKHLVQAANMRKINWSEELAWSAQRWADQCDPAVRPDLLDQCRDLKNIAVGQNIATIIGPSPGLNVKSFIDIWYIQTLEYLGSVSYYNKSRDQKTNEFTQLIWAETDSVGCGKARFYIETRHVMVERLVCNFAPKGNVHGRPVYAVGFPATQCEDDMSDVRYIGLCSYKMRSNERKSSQKIPPIPSLLRILNLSNNSIKQDIDPIKNDLKQMALKDNILKNQKIRHVYNDSLGSDMSPYLLRPPPWNVFNNSRKFAQQHQHERGHSRVYHGHHHSIQPQFTANKAENIQKNVFLTTPLSLNTNGNLRRFNQGNQCTRRKPALYSGCNSPVPCVTNKCTRGHHSDCLVTPPCLPNTQAPHAYPHTQCPCTQSSCGHSTSCNVCYDTTYAKTCPTSGHCCETKCQVQMTSCCPQIGRRYDIIHKLEDKTQKSVDLHYYDLFPNLAIRSGDPTTEQPLKDGKLSFVINRPIKKEKKQPITQKKQHYGMYNIHDRSESSQPLYPDEEHDSYSYPDFSNRHKRESEKQTDAKPFWLINEESNAYPLQLKALRYTTMHKKYKITKSSSFDIGKESITINLKNNNGHEDYSDYSTEKYLSFDELMHLRKANTGFINARRANAKPPAASTTTKAPTKNVPTTKAPTKKAPTTKAPTTTVATPPPNYTVNTPYSRKKFCTRKVTCTWTGLTVTASDGSIINIHTGGGEQGSRTPPGYVEGCTRTSTCTRDYMNRNKISTKPTTNDEVTTEDEDYCERRALNIQRRNSDDETESYQNTTCENANIANPEKNINDSIILDQSIDVSNIQDHSDKATDEEDDTKRKKRNLHLQNNLCSKQCSHRKEQKYKNNFMSYGDLYYLVVSKFVKSGKNYKCSCPCNGNSIVLNSHNVTLALALFITCAYFNEML